jgi:hypothetical protein
MGGLECGGAKQVQGRAYWLVVGPPTWADEQRGSDSHAKHERAGHTPGTWGICGSRANGRSNRRPYFFELHRYSPHTGSTFTAVICLFETGLAFRKVSAPRVSVSGAVAGCSATCYFRCVRSLAVSSVKAIELCIVMKIMLHYDPCGPCE